MKFVHLKILLTFFHSLLAPFLHHSFYPMPLRVPSLCINWPPTVSILFLLWRYLLWSIFSVGQESIYWPTLADFYCHIKSKKSLFIIIPNSFHIFLSFHFSANLSASVWQSWISKRDYCDNIVQYLVLLRKVHRFCNSIYLCRTVQCTLRMLYYEYH